MIKPLLLTILTALTVLCVFFLCVFIYHTIRSKREAALIKPLGRLVEIGSGSLCVYGYDGDNDRFNMTLVNSPSEKMCVYVEGGGEKTIVFMAGSGTPSPILDFKSLYNLLGGEYRIAVVEKFGYGFSDDSDRSRDIDTMLENTRTALAKADLKAPYVLYPHSMSGLEAIYWANKYPNEVSAIIGLDMAVPEYYEHMKINPLRFKLNKIICKMGIARLISNQFINSLYSKSLLAENDKKIVKSIFSRKCGSSALINECTKCVENAVTVGAMNVPDCPMLLFISNGSGGTGFDKEMWRKIPMDYISQADNAECVELDCSHYVHNYEYKAIAEKIKEFLCKCR